MSRIRVCSCCHLAAGHDKRTCPLKHAPLKGSQFSAANMTMSLDSGRHYSPIAQGHASPMPIEPHEVRRYHSLTERQREIEGELRQASYDLISQVARAIGRVGT